MNTKNAPATNSGKQTSGIGAIILAHLAKVGEATTEDLVAVVQKEEKDVERPTIASRLWWLWKKEERLVAKGKGAERVWSLPKGAKPPAKDEAPKSAKVPEAPKSKVAPKKKAAKKSTKAAA